MKGILAQRCPADILSEVLRRQMSGILIFTREPASRHLFVDTGGTIRFAASNHPEESLVSWLMSKGGVSEALLRQATSEKQPHELLGTVLVRLGHLDPASLAVLTESHIRRVLASALAMTEGDWELKEGALPFRDQLDVGVRTADALLEWTRALDDPEWIRSRLGTADARIHRDRRPPEGYQSIRLDPVEGFIVSLVDGAATIRDICMISPTGEEKTLKALLGLTLAGILERPAGSEAILPPAAVPRRVAEATGPVAPYTAAAPPAPAAPAAAPTAPARAASIPPPSGPAAAPRPAVAAAPARPVTTAPTAPSAPPAAASAPASPPTAAPPSRPAASAPGAGAKPGVKPGAKPGARPGLRGMARPGGGRPGARPGSLHARPRPAAAAPPRPAEPAKPPMGTNLEAEMLARHAELHNQDLYHALGVASTDGTDEIRRAYYALARAYHPDKFRNDAMKEKAEQVFGRITEAYATLSNHESRNRYDGELATHKHDGAQDRASDTTDLARENFRRGRDEVDRGRFAEALPFLMHACEQDPNKSEYFEYLGAAQARNPRTRKQAEESLLKAIALSPTNAGAYVHLAGLYERAGAAERAKEMYRQALEWDPDNPAAKRALGQEPAAKRGGLLGFFGRK
jgi:curved DNA-binding protein CbpA